MTDPKYSFVCSMCDGTGKTQVAHSLDNFSESDWEVEDCLSAGSLEEVKDSLLHRLKQFIHCGHKGEDCEGCEVERQEILNLVWHYGNLVANPDWHEIWKEASTFELSKELGLPTPDQG